MVFWQAIRVERSSLLNSTKICTQETEINILLGSVSEASAHLNFSKKTGNTVKPEKLFIIATKKWNSVAHRHNKAYSVNHTQSSSTYYVNQRNWSTQSFGNCIQRSKELNFSLMAFLYGPSFLTIFFFYSQELVHKKWGKNEWKVSMCSTCCCQMLLSLHRNTNFSSFELTTLRVSSQTYLHSFSPSTCWIKPLHGKYYTLKITKDALQRYFCHVLSVWQITYAI